MTVLSRHDVRPGCGSPPTSEAAWGRRASIAAERTQAGEKKKIATARAIKRSWGDTCEGRDNFPAIALPLRRSLRNLKAVEVHQRGSLPPITKAPCSQSFRPSRPTRPSRGRGCRCSWVREGGAPVIGISRASPMTGCASRDRSGSGESGMILATARLYHRFKNQ